MFGNFRFSSKGLSWDSPVCANQGDKKVRGVDQCFNVEGTHTKVWSITCDFFLLLKVKAVVIFVFSCSRYSTHVTGNAAL